MSIETELRRHAKEVAEYAQGQVASLEREIGDLETQIAQKKTERDAARGAAKRLANYSIGLGTNYQCPRCWIEHERRTPLRPVPSNAGDFDLFRCRDCGSDFDIHFR